MASHSAHHVKLVAIDDTPESLELITEALSEEQGLRVFTATDPEDGLDIVFREHPQIVLTDLVMPGHERYGSAGAHRGVRSGDRRHSDDGALLD